ncbi:unnamed protein product [Boreogadus saida]
MRGNMEAERLHTDTRSFDGSSTSELDRAFFGERNQLSTLSYGHLSGSRMSNDMANASSAGRLHTPTSLCQVYVSSPCHDDLNASTRRVPKSQTPGFFDGKVSTPNQNEMHQKPRVVVSFEQSLVDVSASQLPWDLSLIKTDSGPHPYVESTTLESTLSPTLRLATLSLVEIASPIWPDAPTKRA